jgi:hypothetical protein
MIYTQHRKLEWFMVFTIILSAWGRSLIAQQTPPATFQIAVSLPKPTIHVGDNLVVQVITSNPTDHLVFAGTGYRVGVAVELLNQKGEDIGMHAMGGKTVEPVVTLNSNKLAIRPGGNDDFTWQFKPEPGYLVPGSYKLRAHRRDMKGHTEVFSNTVTLTVIP